MDLFVFLALLQDGITTGAIYLLLAIGLLIVFSVTRVIFVPQGDLLALGALTAASLQSGDIPGDDLAARCRRRGCPRRVAVRRTAGGHARHPRLGCLSGGRDASRRCGSRRTGLPAVSILLALAIVTPLGPLIWRFAFRRWPMRRLLALLVLAMALHFVLIGIGLVLFGPEEATAPALTDASFEIGMLNISGQSIAVLLCCARWSGVCAGSSAPRWRARCCAPRPPSGSARAWSASMRRRPARSPSGWPRSSPRSPAC